MTATRNIPSAPERLAAAGARIRRPDLDALARRIDALVAEGLDPWLALVDADTEHRAAEAPQRAVQLSLDLRG